MMTNDTRKTDWNLGAKVEGLGDAAAAHDDKRWRWSQLYQETTTGGGDLYVPVMVDFPSSFAAEVDFRGARSSLGGFSFEMQAQGTGASGIDTASRFYRSRYVPVGFLGLALAAADLTITIVDAAGTAITSLSLPLGIALERECLVLTAHSGSGVYVCKRGEFGTVAAAHSIGAADDTAIFESEHWHIPADREVVLFRCQRNRDLTNEETITRGVVRGVSSPSPDRIRVDCAGPLELLQLRQLCSRLWRASLNIKSANSLIPVLSEETWNDPDYAKPAARDDSDVTGDFRMLLMLDGKSAVNQFWEALSTRFTPNARIQAVTSRESDGLTRPFAGSPLLIDVSQFASKQCWEFFSLHPDAPGLNAAGAKLGAAEVNGIALSSNLFVALLQCLLTTPDGGNHATYDLGDSTNRRLYDNLGFGVGSTLVNITGIEDLALELADLGRMPLLHFGVKGEGFDGLEFFQEALKVLGCVLTSGDDGKLSVVRFRDVARLSTPSIPQADVVGIPRQFKRITDTFDSLVVEYADIPGVGTITDTFDDVINQRRLLSGRHRSSSLKAGGIADRDLFRGPIIARHVQRYHYPIPQIDIETLRSQDHWPGDMVKLTHNKIYGPDSRGVTEATMLVTGRNESIKDGTIGYNLLYVGAAYARVGLIAPSAEVLSYDTGTNLLAFPSNEVYSTVVGPGDDLTSDKGATTWPVGSFVMILRKALGIRDAGPFEVTAVGSGTVTLDADPIGIIPGDVMVPAEYQDVKDNDSVALAKWIWMADSSDTLGTDLDAAYEWTL